MPVTPSPRVPRTALIAVQGIPVIVFPSLVASSCPLAVHTFHFYGENIQDKIPPHFAFILDHYMYHCPRCSHCYQFRFAPFFLTYNLDRLFSLVPGQRLPPPAVLGGFSSRATGLCTSPRFFSVPRFFQCTKLRSCYQRL